MHLQPVFDGNPIAGGETASHLFETSINLPSSARLTLADVSRICVSRSPTCNRPNPQSVESDATGLRFL